MILRLEGSLEVVIPATDYFERIRDEDDPACCDAFLAAASAVYRLPFEHARWEAYAAASRLLVERCEALVAVWAGSTDSGIGDAVAAREQGRDVVVVWPAGAGRQ